MSLIYNNIRYGIGVVLLNKQKLVFAGRRLAVNSKMVSWYLKQPWQMPQGGIEPGEEAYDTCLRELREEIGTDNVRYVAETKGWVEYKLPSDLLRSGQHPIIGQRQKWFLLQFLGTNKDINLKTTSHNEFDTWKWMTIGNVIRLSVHFKHKMYLDVFREFKPYIDSLQ